MGIFSAKNLSRGVTLQGELPCGKTILSRTFKIAGPSVVESVFGCLIGMVDTMMVGSLGSAAIAAIGLTGQPSMLVRAVFIAMNIAVSAIVAHRKGQDDANGARRVLSQALTLAIVLGLILSGLAVVFADPILRFAGSQADTHSQAVLYFRMVMSAFIFSNITLTINAAQRGAGNTKITMTTNLTANIVNVVLNYLLIGGNFGFPKLGIAGAALATMIGTFVGCCMSIASILKPDGFLYMPGSFKLKFERDTMKTILNIGSSSLVEQAFLRVGFMASALVVANLGTRNFAAHQICMNLISLSFTFGDGLNAASVSLTGQSLGMKRRDLARIYMRTIQRIGFIAAVVLCVVFTFVGRYIFMLFTKETPVIDTCMSILPLITTIVFFQIPQVIYGGALRGAGDTKYVAVASIIGIALVRPTVSWFLSYPIGLGLIGAWLGIYIDQIVRMSLLYLRIRGDKWMYHKV